MSSSLYLIILFSAAFLIIIILLMILISYMQKKKTKFILERAKEKADYEEQLLRAEVEITDQNLKNISWELHDNIGQLLSVASMEAKMLMQKENLEGHQLKDIVDIIGQSISQIRGLSKTLNSDVIQKLGFRSALENEFDRLERIGLIGTSLTYSEGVVIDSKKEIVIFRMLQEFISNVLKHAQATELKVKVNQNEGKVSIIASDNGIGFDMNKVATSNGLVNLKSRARLIDSFFSLNSKIGQGTVMKLIFDNKTPEHEKA